MGSITNTCSYWKRTNVFQQSDVFWIAGGQCDFGAAAIHFDDAALILGLDERVVESFSSILRRLAIYSGATALEDHRLAARGHDAP